VSDPSIKVKTSARIGFSAGCWVITREQARKLCGGTLPKMGCERCVKVEEGSATYPGGRKFPYTHRAWVQNQSNARFILRDEGHITNTKEIDDGPRQL